MARRRVTAPGSIPVRVVPLIETRLHPGDPLAMALWREAAGEAVAAGAVRSELAIWALRVKRERRRARAEGGPPSRYRNRDAQPRWRFVDEDGREVRS